MKNVAFNKRAIGITALLLASVAAHADMTVAIGTVTPGDTFSQVVQQNVGAFSDMWSFTISEPTFSAGSVSNLAITVPGLSLYNISGLSAQLYTSAHVLVDDLDDNAGSSDNIKVGSGLFDPGNYYFKLSGTADGLSGGQYVFAVTTLAPVPEPETYAMLLAGLGMIAGIAVRRKTARPG